MRNHPRINRWRAVLIWTAVLTLLLDAGALLASDCEVIGTDGQLRNCTFMEEVGECLDDAKDSWEGCMDWAGGSWWKEEVCDATVAVDLLACAVSVPQMFLL